MTHLSLGYSNTMEGLSGGFVFGAGGSGVITPRWDQTPVASGANSPIMGGPPPADFAPQNINAAFNEQNAPLSANS